MNNSVSCRTYKTEPRTEYEQVAVDVKRQMAPPLRCRASHCILDVLCFLVVGLADLLFHVIPINPVHRGFFCNDESIQKPLQTETVPNWVAIFVGLFVTTVTVRNSPGYYLFRRAGNNGIYQGR